MRQSFLRIDSISLLLNDFVSSYLVIDVFKLTETKNYYALLGVPESADSETIHNSFRRLSKLLHPDTTDLPIEQAAHEFQLVCEAYEELADAKRRRSYDSFLLESRSLIKRQRIPESQSFVAFSQPKRSADLRRPLSGGERFSLLLLGIVLTLCLVFVLGVALLQNRELQIIPNWLIFDQASSGVIINY